MPHKADEETSREQTFINDIIQKAHIERLLLENTDGIRTAFDGGAGSMGKDNLVAIAMK